jgi:hypothetical protein
MTKFAMMIPVMIAATMVASVAAEAQSRARVRTPHGVAAGATGPNGTVVRGRGAVRNADGSVTAGSGGAYQTANGQGARGSTTTVNPDGSATRRSGFAVQGARGTASGSGNVTRNADGTYSGGRTTTATSATTGNSYNGSTQIDPATGKPVRSGTCTNASGQVIACPR